MTPSIDAICRERKGFPQFVYDLFPLVLIYYRKTKPKERMRKAGYEATVLKNERGQPPKIKWRAKKVHFKKYATRQQNIYSYATCCVLDPNDYGTAARSLKHKGFSILIAAVYATDEEVQRERNAWRYHFQFFKSAMEIYNTRKVDDPRFYELCQQLEKEYPSKSYGQLRLH